MSYYELVDIISRGIQWILNSKWFPLFALIFMVVIVKAVVALRDKIINRNGYILSIEELGIGNVKLKINSKNITTAHKMYVELQTRKIGIPFDENDVLVEVYDSWHNAFGAIRELAKDIPPNPENQELIYVATKVLNYGMRPHLTKWQAKFRRWYLIQLIEEKSGDVTPQDIQRRYPFYRELIEDLGKSQEDLLSFMEKLAEGYN
jgi:hypothetical protein